LALPANGCAVLVADVRKSPGYVIRIVRVYFHFIKVMMFVLVILGEFC